MTDSIEIYKELQEIKGAVFYLVEELEKNKKGDVNEKEKKQTIQKS